MILYQIKSNSGKNNTHPPLLLLPQPPFDPKTPEGARGIFLHSLKNCQFKEDTRVRLYGQSKKHCGKLVKVLKDFEEVEWSPTGLPLYLVVIWDSGNTSKHNPSQLTYKRVK